MGSMIYLVVASEYDPKNDNCLNTRVIRAFSFRKNAEKFLQNMPNAYLIRDEDYGEHYLVEPYSMEKLPLWRIRYFIEDVLIEDYCKETNAA